ncbi:hydrogenase maturation protease [Clostridium sp. 'White wine YQ']|uniref:hydrogenase maturation protease n=1 Tax=Clostridium sp. 'White wine YQ' TaxID=3027474 RepID=UPI002366B806|nr:hydrogenase maturation protease [Clostridium sp. 'White wine YQ']MDD7793549.1 hydrogenase maturation protease [Clostridium sp. 'White wine YQ']
MSTKLIAIGNRLMGDDSIAIKVTEALYESLIKLGLNVIIGETDFEFCIAEINEEDFIIVLDATKLGLKAGEITLYDLKNIESKKNSFTQHGYSFVDALMNYSKRINGKFIGIEGSSFDFSLELSNELENRFQDICKKVLRICKDFI